MTILDTYLANLALAIQARDLARVHAIAKEAGAYFIEAFKNIDIEAIITIDPDQPNALEMIPKFDDVPEEIRSLLAGNDINKIYLLTILLNLSAMQISNGKIETIYYLIRSAYAEKTWNTDIELHNLKFLSGQENSTQQSVTGKSREPGKTYPSFKSGMLTQMVPQYHKGDSKSDTTSIVNTRKKNNIKSAWIIMEDYIHAMGLRKKVYIYMLFHLKVGCMCSMKIK